MSSFVEFFKKYRLTFPNYENEFIEEYFNKSLGQFRFSLVAAILFFSFFAMTDALIIPNIKILFWCIRFGFVIPLLLITLLLSYFPWFKKSMQLIIGIDILSCGGAILLMMTFASTSTVIFYYTGLILVLFFGYTLMRARFRYAAISGWLLFIISEISVTFLPNDLAQIQMDNKLYLISANLIGMLACFYLEYSERKNFETSKQLEQERQIVQATNQNLEKRVEERTIKLEKSYQYLQQENKEREKVELTLLRKTQQLELLFKTAQYLTESLDFNEVLYRIASGAKEILDAFGVAIYLLEEDPPLLRPVISIEPPYEEEVLSTPLSLDNSLTGIAVKEKHGMIFNDLSEIGQHIPSTPEDDDKERIISVPFVDHEKVLGAMCLNRMESDFIDEDLNYAEAFGAFATSILRNTQIHKELQQEIQERISAEQQTRLQLSQLNAIHKMDVVITSSVNIELTLNILLEEVKSQLDADAADVLFLDPFTQFLEFKSGAGFLTEALQHTHLHLGEGFAGRAALERKPLVIPDLSIESSSLNRSKWIANENFVSYLGIPLITRGQIKGVLEIFYRKRFNPSNNELKFLESIASRFSTAIDNSELFSNLQHSSLELVLAYDSTLEGWAKALEMHDKETEGHSKRVTDLTLRLAEKMGIPQKDIPHIRRGALLHDIGKMGIPDSILNKPALLTDEERKTIEKHPQYAYAMLVDIPYLKPALDIPLYHHENWDGSGYPFGLKGEEIPITARMFAMIDVWDALCSDRPYRKGWDSQDAKDFILEQGGKKFDPEIVKIFLELLEYF